MPVYVPAVYKCRRHDLDLTHEVHLRVEAAAETIPAPGNRVSIAPAPRPFRVLVRCPGGDDESEAHDLVFPGTLHP